MGYRDHYLVMDGCVVKGCKPYVDFETTFGDYAALLKELYTYGHWGRDERRLLGIPVPGARSFEQWAKTHVHTAQSTQNLRTGATRIASFLASIRDQANIHLFGTSAAGSAILEYFLLCDPPALYYHARDPRATRRPARRFTVDARIASFLLIDPPADWVPLRRGPAIVSAGTDAEPLGDYLARHTRIKAGRGCAPEEQTTRLEDVPGTWIRSAPVTGIAYDNSPHYSYLPAMVLERHIYTGSHMSRETRAFLQRVWR